MVSAGLKADPGRAAGQRSASRRGLPQRHHLGMGATGLLGESFACWLALGVAQHAADARVGLRQTYRAFGELDRLQKKSVVVRGKRHSGLQVRVGVAVDDLAAWIVGWSDQGGAVELEILTDPLGRGPVAGFYRGGSGCRSMASSAGSCFRSFMPALGERRTSAGRAVRPTAGQRFVGREVSAAPRPGPTAPGLSLRRRCRS